MTPAGLQNRNSEQGRKHDGDEPRDYQRDAHDRKERERVFTGGTRCKAYGNETGNGNESACEHREGIRAECERRGIQLVVALSQSIECCIRGRHRVVDQQARVQ